MCRRCRWPCAVRHDERRSTWQAASRRRSPARVRKRRRDARRRDPRTRSARAQSAVRRVVSASSALRTAASSSGQRFGERSMHGGKQPAVERWNAQGTGAAAAVRQPRDRLQRLPDTSRPGQSFDAGAKRIDRVAVAERRVPHRHKSPSLGKQQEQDSIDDNQRLVQQSLCRRSCARRCFASLPRRRCQMSKASCTPACSETRTAARCRSDRTRLRRAIAAPPSTVSATFIVAGCARSASSNSTKRLECVRVASKTRTLDP